MQCVHVCAQPPESIHSNTVHAIMIIEIIISLIVIKCSKANTSAIGDTDCTSKLDHISRQNHFSHLEMIDFQDL